MEWLNAKTEWLRLLEGTKVANNCLFLLISEMSSSRVTVSVRSYDDGGLPLLVAFPQGVPGDGDDMQIIFGEKGEGKKRKHLVLADLNGTKYKGDDIGDNSRKNDSCKFAVGFLPNGSKEMTIFQADHIFVMKPQFENNRVPVRSLSMTNAERRQSLTEEFGSRKKKRALKAAQSNIISSENIAGASAVESAMASQIDETDANSVLVNAAEDALEKNRLMLLPEFDVQALAVEDAYPVKSLISVALNNALKERYQIMNSEMMRASSSERGSKLDIFSWVQRLGSEMTSSLVSSSLRSLPVEEGKATKKFADQFCVSVSRILLLHYMLRFYLKLVSSYDRSVSIDDLARELSGAPADVLDYFADTFCIRQTIKGKPSIQCSKANIDKLLLHTIVVGLTINDFSLNLNFMAKDLKLTPLMLGGLAKELGCKIRKAFSGTSKANADGEPSVMNFADLSVPLKFPERRRSRK